MAVQSGRYRAANPPTLAEGWSLERLTPPSLLFGANGLRTGPDGRIYVAQVSGSQISAIDPASGAIEVVSPLGGDIVGPDDLAFGPDGNIYATEVLDGRVAVRSADGSARVLRGDLPAANGITFHQGRLFIDECRFGGRLLELDLDGGAPRVLLEDIPLPNALEAGPDGKLYFPVMGANEIWRIDPAGGPAEKVAGDLGVPVALKFDAHGYIVSPQTGSGDVLRIDPRTGDRTKLAALRPGLDNLCFVGDRLFVSHLTDGEITEIHADGRTSELLPGGMNGPLGLGVADDGRLYVSDGNAFYVLPPEGGRQRLGSLFAPGYPGNIRGFAPLGDGQFAVATTNGQVALYRPGANESEVIAEGFDQLYGIAAGPGGALVVAEFGTGRILSVTSGGSEVLASGLDKPMGVAIGPDGKVIVSESGGGRVVRLSGATADMLIDGLPDPQGVAVHGSRLYVVAAGAQALIEHDLDDGANRTIATSLPVGAPPGVTPKPLLAMPPFSGPLGPFASVAAGADGTLYLSANAEGSVMAISPSH
jgi:sugar lactone lactonase YvrE